jgi:hypothetical protein
MDAFESMEANGEFDIGQHGVRWWMVVRVWRVLWLMLMQQLHNSMMLPMMRDRECNKEGRRMKRSEEWCQPMLFAWTGNVSHKECVRVCVCVCGVDGIVYWSCSTALTTSSSRRCVIALAAVGFEQ